MKKVYKSTLQRLVAYFETSRNKWKKRSTKYQAEIRRLKIQVRDLKRSKEKWKSKYYNEIKNHNDCKKKLHILEEIKKTLSKI